jgi:hypothetical protein
MLRLAGRHALWDGLSSVRVGPVSSADTGSAPFVPLKPVAIRASAVGEGLVIARVTVFEYASVHPSHIVCDVQRGQRTPEFLVEQHRGKTAIADHCAAQRPKVIAPPGRYKCVIEPLIVVSRGSDAVSAAWDTSLRTHAVTNDQMPAGKQSRAEQVLVAAPLFVRHRRVEPPETKGSLMWAIFPTRHTDQLSFRRHQDAARPTGRCARGRGGDRRSAAGKGIAAQSRDRDGR